jgi:rubrerythrin
MNELEKLAVLIPHWRDHNRAHAQEFAAWAAKARAEGMPEVAKLVEGAAAALSGADDDLAEAASRLEAAGIEAHHHHHHDEHEHHAH